jgi:hypothetical protein
LLKNQKEVLWNDMHNTTKNDINHDIKKYNKNSKYFLPIQKMKIIKDKIKRDKGQLIKF